MSASSRTANSEQRQKTERTALTFLLIKDEKMQKSDIDVYST